MAEFKEPLTKIHQIYIMRSKKLFMKCFDGRSYIPGLKQLFLRFSI